MHLLELVIFIGALGATTQLWRSRKNAQTVLFWLFFTILITLLHFVRDGHRWAMMPAYLYQVFLYLLYRWSRSITPLRTLPVWPKILTVVWLGTAVALAVVYT